LRETPSNGFSVLYIPLGTEDFVSIRFFEKAMAKRKPQGYHGYREDFLAPSRAFKNRPLGCVAFSPKR
jgi:hypothetical protein